MINSTNENATLLYLNDLREQLRYFHLCVYFHGVIGALFGLIFLFRHGKPPTVRVWFFCLSTTDIVSLLGYSYIMFYNHRTRPGDPFTMIIDFLTAASDIFNVVIQVGVSIERTLVLTYGLRSRCWITVKCVKRWLYAIGAFSIVNATGSVVTRWHFKEQKAPRVIWTWINLCFLIMSVIVMVTSSLWIVILIRKKREERIVLLSEGVRASNIAEDVTSDFVLRVRRVSELEGEINLVIRLISANVMFIICYIPKFSLQVWWGMLAWRKTPSHLIHSVQRLFTPILRYNNAFNWIPIYLCHASFRKHCNPCKSHLARRSNY